ncbi:hypothetical protein PSH65_21490 [Pseudomonas sp. FP603]|uniref:Uncharacterized protein n=1 Tax=Pseudomonas wuhanensis TaxID=2954098 RepID=A0ABY9GLD5_9PSED|nr:MULTISPECIES: hypothetical protein [unclassified Pseudomonas]WLI10757.1 hypothetical protein PSH65_21490 [Pseudomonas sp. FP603]WLI16576.1 hypothetical protein PSH88_20115 [Pseudomonas sp. FP607]
MEGYVRGFMAWNGEDDNPPVAEVNCARALIRLRNAKKLRYIVKPQSDDLGTRLAECMIASCVVGVSMGTPVVSAAFSLVIPVAICFQNSRSISLRSDGAPGERIAPRPVNFCIQPAGRPINTSIKGVATTG